MWSRRRNHRKILGIIGKTQRGGLFRSKKLRNIYLWINPEAGPIQPNPEAMVLISTCFQQQNGEKVEQGWVSSMRSDRSMPRLKDCHKKKPIHKFLVKAIFLEWRKWVKLLLVNYRAFLHTKEELENIVPTFSEWLCF